MRILFLTQWFQPEPPFKGLPFAKALRDRGHNVEVLTGFPNYPSGELYPGYRLRIYQREIMDGILVHRVPLYPSHDRSGLRRAFNYLSFALSSLILGPWLVHRPDVIYVYNLVTLGPTAFLLRLFFGAKVLIDVQDLWPESVTNSGMLPNVAANRLLSLICSWIYRRADWLTVLSPGFKQVLTERGISPHKIEVIYNWCDEGAQHPVPRDETLARKLGFAGHFNVLFAGTMGVMQAMDTVLESAKLCSESMPEVQFVLIGDGVDLPRLKAIANDLGLMNVLFLPRQPREAMGALYAISDALLVHLKNIPLFRITIPSKTQAYLYMGRPIIMAVQGDAAELVKQAGAGFICPSEDPIALTETIAKMKALSFEDRETLGRSGAKYYGKHLSMKAGLERFEQRLNVLSR